MSSEGSVSTSNSSRIRQFGLYRTIDARTEEFLRLSRKRQIKQGCACAAISTAITVTVVITVFLVYMEYGMNTDANQQSFGKAGWIGLLNNSLASSFEEKFSKSKINFDRNTIKLLPLIIKALKQNRYLEKIIEDYSSSSPTYDSKVTTEFSFKKDIFLNTKNWLKRPKLYTIEYKTSPIVYFKKPTKSPGFFIKNRKIRDYKRIMEYVEKMINDKVVVTSTTPMANKKPEAFTKHAEIQLHETSKNEAKIKFSKNYKISKNKPCVKKVPKPHQDENVSCKCPKQLGLILDKILTSIQSLIPENKIGKSGICKEDLKANISEPSSNDTQVTNVRTTTNTTSANNTKTATLAKQQFIPVKYSEFDNIYPKEETAILHKETSTQSMHFKTFNWLSTNSLESYNIVSNEDAIIPTAIVSAQTTPLPIMESKSATQTNDLKTAKKFWGEQVTKPNDLHIHDQTTTVYDHIEPTEVYYDSENTTQPMSSAINLLGNNFNLSLNTTTERETFMENKESKTSEPKQMQSNAYKSVKFFTSQERKELSDNISLTNEIDIENEKKRQKETTTTTENVLDKMNKFNIRGFELIKSKLIPPQNHFNTTVKVFDKSTENEYSTTESNEDFIPASTTTEPLTTTQLDYLSFLSKPIEKSAKADRNINSNVEYEIVTPPTRFNKRARNKTKETNTSEQHKSNEPFYWGLENIVLEEEIEKMNHDDEYQEELAIKTTESGLQPYSYKNKTIKLQDKTGYDVWKILKNNERTFASNSMLPQNRPTYLEIHRNDWKHDENKDYDTDMKYNIFDLL